MLPPPILSYFFINLLITQKSPYSTAKTYNTSHYYLHRIQSPSPVHSSLRDQTGVMQVQCYINNLGRIAQLATRIEFYCRLVKFLSPGDCRIAVLSLSSSLSPVVRLCQELLCFRMVDELTLCRPTLRGCLFDCFMPFLLLPFHSLHQSKVN